jgi:16S rRNA (uracil1498-N3)-methyltransferase
MSRFFVSPEILTAEQVCLRGDVAHQITRVLRMRVGDEVCLLDGCGHEYRVRLTRFGKHVLWGELLERVTPRTEPACEVVLYLSLLHRHDKFEWALQKCTELGARRFVPVLAERSQPGLPGSGKYERWQRIVREAAEQSGRVLLPALEEAIPFATALELEAARLQDGPHPHSLNGHMAVIPTPQVDTPLSMAIRGLKAGPTPSVSIFIGPEGGFTEGELAQASHHGILPVSLGPRVLRAETAAVTALAVVLYESGDLA